MNTYGLVLVQTYDGWSLHAPGSTDEQIAEGDALAILSDEGTPTQDDYDAAARKIGIEVTA